MLDSEPPVLAGGIRWTEKQNLCDAISYAYVALTARTANARPVCMWKLSMRPNRPPRQWSELGTFANIEDAAQCVLQHEGASLSALFFRVYVDPLIGTPDNKILSRLEYQSDQAFYVLQHSVQ